MSTIDVFIAAHFVGWLTKGLIFRNNLLVWTLSLSFEIYELTFRTWLPNFYECWWDHLLLDVFGCNLLGILVADWIIKKTKMEKFHWFFAPTEKSENMHYLKRFWYSLTEVRPYVVQMQWHFLANVENFMLVLWICVLSSLIDLSYFFNKKVMGLPPKFFPFTFRVFILGFYSIVVIHDFYRYSRQPNGHRKVTFGMYLSHFIVAAEGLLFWRNFER